MVSCPICGQPVKEANINRHIDSQCQTDVEKAAAHGGNPPVAGSSTATRSPAMSSFFQPSSVRAQAPVRSDAPDASKSPATHRTPVRPRPSSPLGSGAGRRQPKDDGAQQPAHGNTADVHMGNTSFSTEDGPVAGAASERRPDAAPPPKRLKTSEAFQQAAPLADRMRPQTLDEIYGQELVGPFGVLRGLIEQDRVPSMILWGGPGTGKTTIARVIANVVGSRVVEINSTSSGVADCKKIFGEARAELGLTGRKTIIFCDEIHRFSKTQQDVFLGPVESGHVTLIGATTENPSFKVQSALLSRCRTFVLQKLSEEDVVRILERALARDGQRYAPSALVDGELVRYLGAFADGDARTALNLLELAMGLSTRAGMTAAGLRRALTQTFVYDRGGDQHYDSISAFHKAIRGGDANAALYYLGRMLESGEDGLYIARRLVVVASEDVGLADNSMLPLAVAAHAAVERVGLPEARINLAHAAVALAHAKKSTRVYRGLANVLAALKREPGLAGLPIPAHLRNAPTRLMKEVGHGKGYKYNPMYKDGKVAQEYLPAPLLHRKFLEEHDLGTEIDPDYVSDDEQPHGHDLTPDDDYDQDKYHQEQHHRANYQAHDQARDRNQGETRDRDHGMHGYDQEQQHCDPDQTYDQAQARAPDQSRDHPRDRDHSHDQVHQAHEAHPHQAHQAHLHQTQPPTLPPTLPPTQPPTQTHNQTHNLDQSSTNVQP